MTQVYSSLSMSILYLGKSGAIRSILQLKSMGYRVIHCWEHNFLEFLKEFPETHELILNHPSFDGKRLNPRMQSMADAMKLSDFIAKWTE